MHFSRLPVFIAIFLIFLLTAGKALTFELGSPGEADGDQEKTQVTKEDLDKKLDNAIKVLEVIREEVKDLDLGPSQAAPQVPDAAAQQNWIDSLRKNFRAMSRILDRTKSIVGTAPETPQQKAAAAATRKNLSTQLDATMKAMAVIKEELDSGQEASDPK